MAKSSSYQRLSSQSDNGYHKNDSAPFQPQNLFSQTRSGFLPDLLTPENMIKDDIPSGFLEDGFFFLFLEVFFLFLEVSFLVWEGVFLFLEVSFAASF